MSLGCHNDYHVEQTSLAVIWKYLHSTFTMVSEYWFVFLILVLLLHFTSVLESGDECTWELLLLPTAGLDCTVFPQETCGAWGAESQFPSYKASTLPTISHIFTVDPAKYLQSPNNFHLSLELTWVRWVKDRSVSSLHVRTAECQESLRCLCDHFILGKLKSSLGGFDRH